MNKLKRILKEYLILNPLLISIIGKKLDFPLHKKDWKKFELNNKSIALDILYMPYNTEKIRHVYKSKYSLKLKNQVILLMITNEKKWHYLAVRKSSALFKGITSKDDGGFYCLNYFYSYRTENKLKLHYNVCKSHYCCYVEMKTIKY